MKISEQIGKTSNKNQSRLTPLRRNSIKTEKYQMRLFIAGNESNSVIAQKNINEICVSNLKGKFQLEIIDVFKDFTAAIEENILVTPALIIDEPKKMKIFGNLQETEKVLSALGLV